MVKRRPWLHLTAVVAVLLMALGTVACASSSSRADPGGSDSTGPPETSPPKPCPIDALDDMADSDPPEAITAWAPFIGDEMVAFEQLVSSYNASQEKVVVTTQPISPDPVVQRALYRDAAAAGTLPALTGLDSTLTQFVVDSQHAVDASACLKEAGKETASELPVARSAYTVDGKQWAVSANLVTPLLYFRRGAFISAGLDPDKPPTDLEQLRQTAQTMQTKGVASKPVALTLDADLIENWLTGGGLNVVNHGNGRNQRADAGELDKPKVAELFEWIADMTREGLLEVLPDKLPGVPDQTPATTLQTAALTIAPSTAIGDFAPTALGAAPDLDVATLPGLESAGDGQVGGVAWYLTKDLRPTQIAAGWDFANFLNSVPSQVTWNLVGSYPPFNPRAVDDPGLVDAWSASRRGPWLDTAYTQVTNLDPAGPGPLIGPYPTVRLAIDEAVRAVVAGTRDVPTVMAEANDAITAALGSYDPTDP